MARIPTRGATSVTPYRTEAELGKVLSELCPTAKYTASEIRNLYRRLGAAIGEWSAEQTRPDTKKLASSLAAISKSLKVIATTFGAHQTGIRELNDVVLLSHLANVLAMNPEVGSPAHADQTIDTFRKDANRIGHACAIAARDLQMQTGKSGRPPLDWHNAFRKLLLEVAERGGVKPQSWKDREDGQRHGWLTEAAQKLETFLPPAMRSPGREASGKRLERANLRLKPKPRQNPASS